jgi:hypothetical protein
MPPMKKNTFFSTVMLVLATTTSAWAMSAGTSASQDSLLTKESQKTRESIFNGAPTRLGFGAYYEVQKRGIEAGGPVQDWKVTHKVAYVTLDVAPWLTLLGGGGANDVDWNGRSGDGDGEWIGGGTLRLIDYFAMDPIVGDEPYWLSVDLDGQFTAATAGDTSWDEFYSAMLLNVTSKTERWGFMDRVALYFGPAYSKIDGSDDYDNDFSQDQEFGFVAGISMSPNDNLTIKTEMKRFDDTSWGVGASFHF